MAAGAASSHSVGCVILAGGDFPEHVLSRFQGLGLDLVLHKRPDANSTRGLLRYLDSNFGSRSFPFGLSMAGC